MARDMKQISPIDISHNAIMQDIQKGRLKQIASCSSVGWGMAELFRFGKTEYVLMAMRVGDIAPGLWFGEKQETRRTWRALCKVIAMSAV